MSEEDVIKFLDHVPRLKELEDHDVNDVGGKEFDSESGNSGKLPLLEWHNSYEAGKDRTVVDNDFSVIDSDNEFPPSWSMDIFCMDRFEPDEEAEQDNDVDWKHDPYHLVDEPEEIIDLFDKLDQAMDELDQVMDLSDELDDVDVVPAEVVDKEIVERAKEVVDRDEVEHVLTLVNDGDVILDEVAVDLVDYVDVVLDEVVAEEILEDQA
ncbi:hypothetical protein Tco_0551632 [Tanacetum coccineum]